MNVILCEDVDNLGDMGETVRVAPGYARNYLLPRKLAVLVDSASARQIEHEMRIINKRQVKRRAELTEVAQGLEGLELTFTAKAGAEGKLFGSITNAHIATRLQELGHAINRRKIELHEPIRSLGEHEVKVTLTSGIGASIKVIVEAEAPEPGESDAGAEKSVVAAAPDESSAEEAPEVEPIVEVPATTLVEDGTPEPETKDE